MTNFNSLLASSYKITNILPIVFDCSSLTDKSSIKEYMISDNQLALFLDIDDYDIESIGGDNEIYHNIFSSSNNIIDINSKRPFLKMFFKQSDYNIYIALHTIILKAFEENKLVDIIDYHFLKNRSILVKSLKINGGVNRVLQESIDPLTQNVITTELRYIPNGFTLTAIENTFTLL